MGLASGEFPRPAASLGLLSRFRPTISATQPNIVRVPPRKPSLALGVVSLAPGRPRKMGQEKGENSCLTCMLSGIGLARGSSDVAASCVPPDVDLLTGASRNVGLRRRRRSD